MGKMKDTLLGLGKNVLTAALMSVPVIGLFVVLDDWYARRTRIEVIPYTVAVDESLMRQEPFPLDAADRHLLLQIADIDTTDYLQATVMQVWASAVVGGKTENIGRFNLNSLYFARKMMEERNLSDSLLAQDASLRASAKRDSVRTVLEKRQKLLRELQSLIAAREVEMETRKRFRVVTRVVNYSNNNTAATEPAILKVVFEGKEMYLPLKMSGPNTEMSMLGMGVSISQPGETKIEARSHTTITFYSGRASDLGKEWSLINKALDAPGAVARIAFYAADGSVVESTVFPFSADFSDKLEGDKREVLKHNL